MPYKCLSCKHEPEWSEPFGGEYPRQSGDCMYKVDWPKIPYVYRIHKEKLIRYSDDSGLPVSCDTWEPKE